VAETRSFRYRGPVTYLLLLAGCIGLATKPDRTDGDHDLDSGDIPLDSGDPIDSATDANQAPEADAGDDAEGSVGVVVGLDGSGSTDPDGDPLTYTWRLVGQPSSSSASLVDDDRADPQFIPDVAGRYVVGLVVSDGALDSAEDSVEITVTEANGAPIANAGPNQSVTTGDTVTLDGSGSSDPEEDPLQFAWTLVTRPSGSSASLSSSSSATPRFTADVAGSYEISLTVSDGSDVSAPDSVTVVASESSSGGDSGSCGCRTTSGEDAGFVALVLLALPIRRRVRRA
jgi:MYXO-CTERM domain-containing protein